jgi:hypothetical protein
MLDATVGDAGGRKMIRYTAIRTARRVAAAAMAVAACFAAVTMARAAAAPAVSQAAPAVSLVHSAGSVTYGSEHEDNTQWHSGGA